jgi:hypothetical protein
MALAGWQILKFPHRRKAYSQLTDIVKSPRNFSINRRDFSA